MQKRPKVAALAVMVKITHHHRGAGCSTTSEMRCVSQLKLRRFKTSGTCAIRRSASWTCSGAAAGAPSMIRFPIADCRLPIATNEIRKPKTENSSGCFLLQTCDSDVLRVRHFRVWIAKAREITRSRNNVQIVEDSVIAVLLFHL